MSAGRIGGAAVDGRRLLTILELERVGQIDGPMYLSFLAKTRFLF